jgi:hypothetical protein
MKIYKYFSLTILVIIQWGCGSSQSLTKIENFWKWFAFNEDRIYNLEKEQDKIFAELKAQIDKVDSNLVFEFSAIQNGKREFIISADGNKKIFPIVEKLYKESPNLNRFIVIKYRPRREPLSLIEYEGIKLSPDDIGFELFPHDNKIDITLYIRNYNEAQRNDYGGLAFLFLDAALGEYDVETKVGKVEVKTSTHNENNIRFLAKKFDEIFASIK